MESSKPIKGRAFFLYLVNDLIAWKNIKRLFCLSKSPYIQRETDLYVFAVVAR